MYCPNATSSWYFPVDAIEQPTDPASRLKRVEDQVRSDFESRDALYCMVAYKYLHCAGMRIAAVDAEIHRELRRRPVC